MSRSADDYASAFRRLLPKGRVWNTEPGSGQSNVAMALSRVLARIDAAVSAFLAGSLPGGNEDLLPEWEATLGITNVSELTPAQRSAQIRSRFIAGAGPSIPFITSYAQQLGFAVTLARYAPARAGITTAGGLLYSEEWCFAIGVTVTANANGLPPSSLISALQSLSAHIYFFLIE